MAEGTDLHLPCVSHYCGARRLEEKKLRRLDKKEIRNRISQHSFQLPQQRRVCKPQDRESVIYLSFLPFKPLSPTSNLLNLSPSIFSISHPFFHPSLSLHHPSSLFIRHSRPPSELTRLPHSVSASNGRRPSVCVFPCGSVANQSQALILFRISSASFLPINSSSPAKDFSSFSRASSI